jgi:peptide/nickel transport system substrate-binding protein
VKRSSTGAKLAAVLLGAGLIATACGSSKSASTSTTAAGAATTAAGAATTAAGATTAAPATTAATATTAAGAAMAEGGTLSIGAEQEPDCADVINSCGGSSWGFWMMTVGTLPRAYDVVKEGEAYTPKPSNVLVGEPTLVTSPKQVVTYKINPKAVWSTGDPITSADFKYMFEQIAGPDAKDVYDPTGYDKIESVDATAPDTAVVTFKEIYADWKGLFGGSYGLMPSKLLTGKDRNAEMKDGYKFSGGPWIIDKWEKGVGITLVPNDKYWGDKPKLSKVVFKFLPDTAAEFQAYKAGEVALIHPQPQVAVIDAISAGVEGNSSFSANTGSVEAIWINNAKAPFDKTEVRQALAYSIDRDTVVNKLFGGIGVKKAVQSFSPPIVSKFAGTDFDVYKKDLAKVDSLMKGAGYAKGADGIWAKGADRASFALRTTAGNKRRELTQEILIQLFKEAGFEMTVDNIKAGDLFGKALPGGDYQTAIYAQVATFPVPSLTNQFLSTNIPSDANKQSGTNWTRTNIAGLDDILKASDKELDETKRIALTKQADKLLAADATSIPLDPLPDIMLWSKKLTGPNDNTVLGPFWNMNTWTLAK